MEFKKLNGVAIKLREAGGSRTDHDDSKHT
jgi:hypothetical protein